MKHVVFVGVVAAIAAVSGSAFAADMAMKAPPPAYPAYDWGGLYVGGVLGGAWGTIDTSDPGLGVLGTAVGAPVIQTTSSSGFIGGVEGGSNYQMGKLVIGWEADITWGGLNGTSTSSFGAPLLPSGVLNQTITANTNWTATTTSRLGIAHDRWLIYGKAGVAYAHTNYTDNWTTTGGFPLFTGANSENRVGWTVGAGIEWAIWNTWSIKAEYDYLDFGRNTVSINGSVAPSAFNLPASVGLQNADHISQFKAGVNWKFLPNLL